MRYLTHDFKEPWPEIKNPKTVEVWVGSHDEATVGEPSEKTIFEYNEKGQKIKEEQFNLVFDMGMSKDVIWKWKYDSRGDVVEEHYKSSFNDSVERYEYTYSGDKLINKAIIYNREGTMRNNIEYKYDNDNKLIKTIHEAGFGIIITEYEYDDKNRLIRELEKRKDKIVLDLRCSYEEYEEGYNVKITTAKSGEKKVGITIESFNAENNQMFIKEEERMREEGFWLLKRKRLKFDNRVMYFYDAEGRLVSMLVWDKNEVLKGFEQFLYKDNRLASIASHNSEGKIVKRIYYNY